MGQAVTVRLWYPQLDVYDAVRRMLALLASWSSPMPTHERLYVVDFYFANPPLLHNVHMPADVRRSFRDIEVPRPEKTFLSYPSAPILFSKMEPVQREGLRTLVGKGLIDLKLLETGRISPSTESVLILQNVLNTQITSSEQQVLQFLVKSFSTIGIDEPGALRAATGLRRARG